MLRKYKAGPLGNCVGLLAKWAPVSGNGHAEPSCHLGQMFTHSFTSFFPQSEGMVQHGRQGHGAMSGRLIPTGKARGGSGGGFQIPLSY